MEERIKNKINVHIQRTAYLIITEEIYNKIDDYVMKVYNELLKYSENEENKIIEKYMPITFFKTLVMIKVNTFREYFTL